MTAITFGPDGPQWIDLRLPTRPATGVRTIDPVTWYLTQCVRTAVYGAVISGETDVFVEMAASSNPIACSCGAVVKAFDCLIAESGELHRHILPPLGLHYAIWHRMELEELHPLIFDTLTTAANADLVHRARDFAPEPPFMATARQRTSLQQALTLLHFTREQMKGTTRPDSLTGYVGLAASYVSNQVAGWDSTDGLGVAAIRLYEKLSPGPIIHPTLRLLTLIHEWALSATYAQAIELLDSAISELEQAVRQHS